MAVVLRGMLNDGVAGVVYLDAAGSGV